MCLHAYLPQDRLRALVSSQPLPNRAMGPVLFADISGFTALNESLTLAREPGDLTRELFALNRVGTAYLHIDLAETERLYTEVYTRALAIWGLARHHPAWSSDDQRDFDMTLSQWALDPAVVEAGLAKGAELDWEKTIEELIKPDDIP